MSSVCPVQAETKKTAFFSTMWMLQLLEDTLTRVSAVMVLFLVFTTHAAADKQDSGTPQCEPQNMLLSNVSQTLTVTWEVHSSCASLRDLLIYELVVFVEDKQVHQEEFTLMPDPIESSHWWSWMSFLPLECASHSVWIRSRYQNQTSPWTKETLPGQEPSGEIQVYPQDQVFEVGSRVTFCCIVPLGETFSAMSLSNYNDTPSNTSTISNHTYALTVDLLLPTRISDADIKCKTQRDEAGSCAVVGYPPSDSDLKCETRDFLSVQCYWTVGRQTFTNPTKYWLIEQPCSGDSKGKCSQKVKVDYGERNWTLIARNVLGTIELADEADLTKRVYMYAPEHMTVSALTARSVHLRWTWTVKQYNLLNLTCKINLYNGATNTEIEKSDIGLHSVVLNGLIPNWNYSAMVQCGTAKDFWKWSEMKSISFHTKGDIPDVLDVWMHKVNHQTVIIWKLLEDHQSHGHIIDYEVTWIDSANAGQENKICVVHPNHSVPLNLSPFQKYIVKVTARNTNGSSDPSQIIISSQSQDPEMITSRINGIGHGFSLSWAAIDTARCGYIVDWCPVSGDCTVEWLKVPPSNTSATVYSKNFKYGVRYILSVYICTEDAPVLLEKREGYVKELRIPDNMFKNLSWQQHGSDVEISWNQINLKEQSAFINGYVLYCTHESTVHRVSTDDPEATSLTAKRLNITSYKFVVFALTSDGECGLTTIIANLNIQMDNLLSAIIISLVTAFTLILLITIVCYRHWACIKQKVYPPIPEPVLRGKWLPPQDVMPYCPREELTIAAPTLHNILYSPTSNDGDICQKGTLTTSPQTPTLHLSLKKLQTSSLTPTRLTIIPNPVYNLAMLENMLQFDLETECQDFQEDSSNDYQPQLIENLLYNQTDTGSIMSCISAYIEIPHSS